MGRLFEVAQANGQMSQGSFNPAEADTFSAVIVQNFDGVAVEDGNDGAGEVGGRGIGEKKEDKTRQK